MDRSRRTFVVALLTVGMAAGCAASSPEVPTGPDGQVDAALVTGRDIYSTRCSSCHGSEGQGASATRLNNGEALAAYPNSADMAAVISEGASGGMPAFGESLTAEEIDAVNRYIREVLNPA